MACDRCLGRANETLAGILLMFDELPEHLREVSSAGLGRERGGGDGRPLPGGDGLALLGPGSVGNVSRFGDDYDPPPQGERWWVLGSVGPLTLQAYVEAERRRFGKEHLADNTAGDPVSVAWTLSSWEADWREFRGEQIPDGWPRSTAAVVRHAARYLQQHARWAATSHSGFDDYADDLRLLHGSLEAATGRALRRSKANAECFACGGDLVRPLLQIRVEQWWLPGAVGPLPQVQVWEGMVEETVVNGRGEEEPVWACARCHERYDKARYNLALGDRIEEGSRLDVAGEAYATPQLTASLVGRREQTVRNWLGQGLLRRQDRHGQVYVSVGDARRESDTRRRRRLRASA